MRYGLTTLYFFVHKSLERDNKKEKDEGEKCEITRENYTIFFEMLLCISSYHIWKISSQ